MTDKTCAERIDSHYDNVMETLRILWAGYTNSDCPECDGTGNSENRGGRTTCPECGEDIKKEFETCPHCESEYLQNVQFVRENVNWKKMWKIMAV